MERYPLVFNQRPHGSRMKRNVADYDRAGTVSESEVRELLEQTEAFRVAVLRWLASEHSELLGDRG